MRSRLWMSTVLLTVLSALMISSCARSEAGGTVVRVGAERAVVMIEAGRQVVLDLRTPQEYDAGHVAGAVNLDASEEDFAERLADLGEARDYLVYSRSKQQSSLDADELVGAGIERVFDGGAFGLLALAGAPLE